MKKPDILKSTDEFIECLEDKNTGTIWVKYKDEYGDILIKKSKQYYFSSYEEKTMSDLVSTFLPLIIIKEKI